MRDGIEYEFDVCGDVDLENTLAITKSRCPKLAGGVYPKPGKELAGVLKQWLGGVPGHQVEPEPPRKAQVEPVEPKKGGVVNGVCGLQTVAVLTEELAATWKRMCSPRGVVKEFDALKASVEALPGSTGVAEYYLILRQHGVDRPGQFQSTHPARLCVKKFSSFWSNCGRTSERNKLK
jgi:hypothetical protein